jgi:abequosyltransferase
MLKSPKISICIPTYNRVNYLTELIDGILNKNLSNQVEIVISDNASIDETESVIKNYQVKFSNIVYHRWDLNVGADRNYLKTIEISTGEYCWLMGSDDLISEDAISYLLELLGKHDIYLFGRVEADINLKPIENRAWLDNSIGDRIYNFQNKEEITEYFLACRRLGGLFSYLSSIVVKRESWQRIEFNNFLIGTLYSHAFILTSLIQQGCLLFYSKKPIVITRLGNDSFLTDWTNRALIDFRGYKLIGEIIFNDLQARNAFFNVMKYEHPFIKIVKTKAMSSWNNWPEYKILAINTYSIKKYKILLAEILYPFTRTAYLIKKYIKS